MTHDEAMAEHTEALGRYLRQIQDVAHEADMSVEHLLSDWCDETPQQADAAPTYDTFLALKALLAELEG